MNKVLLGIFVIVLIGGASLFIFSIREEKTAPPSPTASADVSPVTATIEDFGASANSYLDDKGVFSMLYPNDWILDTQDPVHIRIYKKGDTQRPQSEMSDGALMVFETIQLQGKSLESWVDTRIKESTADGTSEVVEAKKTVTIHTYPGFTYALRGLGVSQNIVLQKDKNADNAVVITYSISDPQQKGYQKEIDVTLASLQLLK